MKILFVLVVCSTVALAQQGRRGPGGQKKGPPRGPPYSCDDGEKADCDLATKTCTCADGSKAIVRSPCADGEHVQCPKGCPGGIDAVFAPDPFTRGPCPGQPGVKPKLSLCFCPDGTDLGKGTRLPFSGKGPKGPKQTNALNSGKGKRG